MAELTKPAAKRKLLDIITTEGVNTPAYLERSLKPATTFNHVADAWETRRLPQLKESTRYAAPRQLAKYLRPFFGPMSIEAIKTGTVNEWIAELQRRGLEPKTIHNLWKMFRAIMNWHAQQNDEAPRRWYPTLPSIPPREQRWFTQEEVGRIVEAASGQYKVLFHLAGSSGLRAGELFGLHVEDVDLNRGLIRVRRSVYRGQETSPKTAASIRDVWLDAATVQILREYLAGRMCGRIFQTRNGTPLSDWNVVREVLHPICLRLGIEPGGMHAFRHGRVSHLQANNVPPDFTKSQVGHSSLRTTSGYTHFSESFSRELVERTAPRWTH